MALFKGHTVGSGFAENVNLLNSAEASEAELAELGNESLASDLDGGDFSLANFGSLLQIGHFKSLSSHAIVVNVNILVCF